MKKDIKDTERKNIIPRACAVHDLSGFALTEVIPIMSAMGIEVCPLPTAVLSTHTYEFTDYTFCDLLTKCRLLLTIGIT
ncbi:MAG: hypothetical protein ACLSUQ_06235 [Monoglobus pectinilyticus]